jgi:hypothetical protein
VRDCVLENADNVRVRRAAWFKDQKANLRHLEHLGGVITTARRRRQGLAISLVQIDGFIDRYAQLVENRHLVVAVATAVQQSGTLPTKQLSSSDHLTILT